MWSRVPLTLADPSPIFHSKNAAFGARACMLMSVFIGAARGTILSPIVRVELTVKVFSALDTFPYRFAIVTPTLCVPTSEKVYLPIDPHLSGLFSSTLFPSITQE